jgi:hypothetical protein
MEKISLAVRGTLFPPQKTKNPFSGGHQKIPCQHRGFPVSERFGKKIQEFWKKILQCKRAEAASLYITQQG